jgi:hypothetical protein
MNWGMFLLVVIIASVVTSITDWLFMGVLFHDKYKATPEIWRLPAGGNERSAILYSQIFGIVSCVGFAALCVQGNLLTVPRSLAGAVFVWLAGPVVVLAQMVLWTKLHPLIGVSQSLGWLARFALTGLLAVWLL